MGHKGRKNKKPTSKSHVNHLPSFSPPSPSPLITIPNRSINMYKYKSDTKKPLTAKERHANSNKQRRKEVKDAKYRHALAMYDAQVAEGIDNPDLLMMKRTPAQERRKQLRSTMREVLQSGDLTHIPLLIDFLKKMHSPSRTNRYESDQLHRDPQHVALVKDDVSALQSYGLFVATPQDLGTQNGQNNDQNGPKLSPGQKMHPNGKKMIKIDPVQAHMEKLKLNREQNQLLDKRIFGVDTAGLETYRLGKDLIDANAPDLDQKSHRFDEKELLLQSFQDDFTAFNDLSKPAVSGGNDAAVVRDAGKMSLREEEQLLRQHEELLLNQQQSHIATPLKRDPHAHIKRQGNDLSRAILEPMYDMMAAGNETTTSLTHLQQETMKLSKNQPQKAASIGLFKNLQDTKQYATLQPMAHSITGDVISSISLNNDEFGSLAGSPTFRINPQNLKKVRTSGPSKTGGSTFNEEIDDEDEVAASRDLDAQFAMDNQGTIGLNDSPLQKHASEFTTASLIPTLGFLREYHAQHGQREKRAEAETIDGLSVDGIGGLQRREGHYSNPRQQAVISGRRSRAIETIARTSAAVLAKRQLLAHNRNILTSISPTLAQGSREQRDKHYVDLYSLGYQITAIHLTKDLSTCVINWSAPCLFPLPQSKDTMELDRPLLDVVNHTLHGDAARMGRIELQPQNDAMRHLANSTTHLGRRANHEIGANLTRKYQFTAEVHNRMQEREHAEIRAMELATGGRTEIFFDDKSGVAMKKTPDGQVKILSQGNPSLWQLRPMFAKGSYVPGTVDMLPPNLRKNSQVMTEQQRQQRQAEADRNRRMEELNIQAGLEGRADPRLLHSVEELQRMDNMALPTDSFGMEEIGLGPGVNANLAKQTLDAMVNTDINNNQLSHTTYIRALRLVASATEYYLNSMVPSIRWALGQALNTKYVPQLKFEFDVQYGETKQRAKTINAVLQRQYKKQIDKVEFGDQGDDEYQHLDQDHQPIPQHTIGSAQERQDKIELALEKQKLFKKGKFEEVQIIDEYVKNERQEQVRGKVRDYEQGTFNDYDEVSPHDEAMMKRQQVKDDNISKMLATAQALKTGEANEIALSTRLKYHDITKADKVKLVAAYLEMPEAQAKQLSEDRIEVVISMLRRDMAMAERKKQRQTFKDQKIAEGLSKAQLEREMIKYDSRLRKKTKKGGLNGQDDEDDNDGVSRWQAGMDSDAERPDFAHLMETDDNDNVADLNPKGHRDDANSVANDDLQWGSQDRGIAAAFMNNDDKDARLTKGGKGKDKKSTARQKMKLEIDDEDLVKFRQQYLYGDDGDNASATSNGKSSQGNINDGELIERMNKKNAQYLEFDEESSEEQFTKQKKNTQQQQQQQSRQNNNNKQYLEFSDDSMEDDVSSDDSMPQSRSRLALQKQQEQKRTQQSRSKQYLEFDQTEADNDDDSDYNRYESHQGTVNNSQQRRTTTTTNNKRAFSSTTSSTQPQQPSQTEQRRQQTHLSYYLNGDGEGGKM